MRILGVIMIILVLFVGSIFGAIFDMFNLENPFFYVFVGLFIYGISLVVRKKETKKEHE